MVVPIVDVGGNITQAYGRKVGRALRAGTPLHLWLPGSRTGVWNGEAFAAGGEVIVCESLIDALSFWCWGSVMSPRSLALMALPTDWSPRSVLTTSGGC